MWDLIILIPDHRGLPVFEGGTWDLIILIPDHWGLPIFEGGMWDLIILFLIIGDCLSLRVECGI